MFTGDAERLEPGVQCSDAVSWRFLGVGSHVVTRSSRPKVCGPQERWPKRPMHFSFASEFGREGPVCGERTTAPRLRS